MTLKDVQNIQDTRGVDIQKVGIKDVAIPLVIQRKDADNQTVSAKVKMSVSLPKNYKGTHMSRFMEILNIWQTKHLLPDDIKGCLKAITNKLHSTSAEVKFSFKYFLEKKAPVSKIKSLLDYDCFFKGVLQNDDYKFYLGAKIPVTTLCPCSKEISEKSAHNQRAIVKVSISYPENEHIWLEDLIKIVEECGSCEIYSLLKRADEKHVTEKAYANPKFVEDIIRDIVLKLRNHDKITDFEVEVEAFESIHNHSAWAYQKEIK